MEVAYNTVKAHLESLIKTREEEVSGGTAARYDVFSLMFDASQAEGSSAMTNEELVSAPNGVA